MSPYHDKQRQRVRVEVNHKSTDRGVAKQLVCIGVLVNVAQVINTIGHSSNWIALPTFFLVHFYPQREHFVNKLQYINVHKHIGGCVRMLGVRALVLWAPSK